MITTGSGLAILIFSVPPLVAGAWVMVRGAWARTLGALVGAVYAAFIAYVATTPLRGITPPPGQSREPMDLGLVMLATGFALATLLIVAGKPLSPRR